MPKRLRTHLKAKAEEREREQAAYPWPCKRCEKLFLPTRNPEWLVSRHGEWSRFCATCQITNLITSIFDSPEKRKEAKQAFGIK